MDAILLADMDQKQLFVSHKMFLVGLAVRRPLMKQLPKLPPHTTRTIKLKKQEYNTRNEIKMCKNVKCMKGVTYVHDGIYRPSIRINCCIFFCHVVTRHLKIIQKFFDLPSSSLQFLTVICSTIYQLMVIVKSFHLYIQENCLSTCFVFVIKLPI